MDSAVFEDIHTIGSQQLLKFWAEHLQTDVDFRIQCGEDWMHYPAHKLILSIWSPKLADLFYGDSDQKIENAITITDVLPSVFETMLRFMYGSKAELHRQRNDISFILKVYRAALKFQVNALRVLCFEMLSCTAPNAHNVFDLLEANQYINSDVLKFRCHKILQSETRQVLSNLDLSNVSTSMIKTILNLPSVSFSSEYELAVWIFAWAKNKTLANDQNFKTTFPEILPLLKLTSLSAEEFGKLMQDQDIISESDGFKILMNSLGPGSRILPSWCEDAKKVKRRYSYVANSA